MNQKNMKKMPVKRSPLMTAAKAVMLLLSLWFSCAMPLLSGAGLLYNRSSYGEGLARTGSFLIISAILMTAGAVSCLSRRMAADILSIVLSAAGLALCMVMLKRLTDHADASGWADKYTMLPISDMYSRRILPCIIPVTMAVTISAVQLFSNSHGELHSAKNSSR